MPDILHRVGMRSPPEKVYQALSTAAGLSRWWITGTEGDGRPGSLLRFRPDGGGFEMRVVEAVPGQRVAWRCEGSPPEWIGTEISFRLERRGDETFLLFRHAGWKEPVEFMHHCSTKWAVFLLSLKGWVDDGEGRPHPYDVKLHPGD